MNTSLPLSDHELALEAPGEFLSGLLAVSRASVLTIRAGTVRNLPPEHGVWRIISPLSGRLRMAWASRSWALEGPQAAVVFGGEDLSLLSLEDCRIQLLCLRGSAADAVFDACRRAGGLFFSRGGLAAERMMRLLAAEKRHIPAKTASEYAYQLLMALYGTAGAGPEADRKLPLVVEAALGIMRREFAFLDGVAELADRLEVSQEYLTRCFCRYIGITPGKYLTQLRIENAKLLLRQGNHSVQFVSDACGFSNANYFARVFRNSVGVNPRDYTRRQDMPPAESDSQEESLYVL